MPAHTSSEASRSLKASIQTAWVYISFCGAQISMTNKLFICFVEHEKLVSVNQCILNALVNKLISVNISFTFRSV